MSYQPIAYRGRVAMSVQPRVVTHPMAYGDRAEFVEQTLLSLLDEGDAYWRIHGVQDDPSRSAIVLPPTEVTVQWARRFEPVTKGWFVAHLGLVGLFTFAHFWVMVQFVAGV